MSLYQHGKSELGVWRAASVCRLEQESPAGQGLD